MKTISRQSSTFLVLGAALLVTATAFSGCGQQAFLVTASVQDQQAPGNFMVPPKVDILLAEDNTGSMNDIFPTMKAALPSFLRSLDAKGWDYHLATIPLATDRPLTAVTASKHDGSYGSQWISTFPGATPDRPDNIVPSFFFPFDTYVDNKLLTAADAIQGNALNGLEPGLQTIDLALTTRVQGTGFLRDDALLVVLVVGNGEDTSGVRMCPEPLSGNSMPCKAAGYPELDTQADSFDTFKTRLIGTKRDASQLKFYSAVAHGAYKNCLGGISRVGQRYKDMSAALGGQSYDVCKEPLTQVLDSLSNHLHITKLSFRTKLLFINQEPELSTVEVLKYPNGDRNNPVRIEPLSASNPTNGWSYRGYVTDYAIDSPVSMNLATGYAIELHGTARLIAEDQATVVFKPAGAQNSH